MPITIRDLEQWPTREADVTADGMIRSVGVDAQRAWLQTWKARERKDEDGRALYLAQVQVCLAAVGFIGCLRALRAADPAAAQRFAVEYWQMCEDGGAIGEMLWEWLEQAGVDPSLVELPLAADAVDPHAGSTGKPTTRDKSASGTGSPQTEGQ